MGGRRMAHVQDILAALVKRHGEGKSLLERQKHRDRPGHYRKADQDAADPRPPAARGQGGTGNKKRRNRELQEEEQGHVRGTGRHRSRHR